MTVDLIFEVSDGGSFGLMAATPAGAQFAEKWSPFLSPERARECAEKAEVQGLSYVLR